MAKEWEFPIQGGSLYYEKAELEHVGEGICITRMQGLAGEVEIPAQIAGLPVRAIGRKAFLSKKNLRKVTVPGTVVQVGDWAFAYCDNLHTVVFTCADGKDAAEDKREAAGGDDGKDAAEDKREAVAGAGEKSRADVRKTAVDRNGEIDTEPTLRFGKAVFLECGSLRFVYVKDGGESTAALLAAAVTVAEAAYLLDAQEAGSREWLEKWDARMLTILHSADDEGYSRQILCGEEDYGSTDLVAYESARRKMKVRLLLLRCLYPEALSQAHKEEIEKYLRMHSKPDAGSGVEPGVGKQGTAAQIQDETWQVILREHGEEQAYYELFTALGCVTEGNFDALLAEVGEEYPQLRAYLMRYKEEKLGYSDFFADLEL